MSLRDQFLAFDDRLAAAGVPPLTAWWRDGIGTWLDAYESGEALQFFACVGRGAAKSTALYKLATFFSLFGDDFVVPVGERHYAIVLSRIKEEASKGIAIIAAWLRLLGVKRDVVGDVVEVEVRGQKRGIRVVAASVAAASGWRAYFVGKDERSKWSETGVEEREGEEIDVSASAMAATHARAPECSFGSAYYAVGPFFDAVVAGSTDHRVVLGPTPTWVAAPHITEESTRRRERNESKWRREYACEFQSASEECIFPPEVVDPCIRADARDISPAAGHFYIAALDAGFSRNSTTLAIGTLADIGARQKATIVLAREWRPVPGQPLDPASIMEQVAALTRPYGIPSVHVDQHHAESLGAICARLRLGITLLVDRPTANEKVERHEGVLTRFLDGEVSLPNNRQLRADLLAVRRRMNQIVLPQTSDGRHADFAPSVVLVLSRIARAVVEASRADRRRQRDRFLMAAISGETPDEVMGLPAGQRHDATLRLANGAPIESVTDPDAYFARQLLDVRASESVRASLQRDLERHDEYLNSIGSPAGSKYRPPPPRDPAEVARLADLHARVQRRLQKGTGS